MKTDLFQSCGHCWVFQICWHIEYSTFTASSFRIWNSSTGIPSPPLALFIVCFLRPTWLHIPGCLALDEWAHHHGYPGHEDFLYSSSVYSCHVFLISSASVRSIKFLSFIEPIFAWNVPLVSPIFLKRSLVFSCLLFSLFLCVDHWRGLSYLFLLFFGTLHSEACIFPFLLCFSHLFFLQLFVRPPQSVILLFRISFLWGWSWSLSPVQCHKPYSIVHQALCLSV